jgi:opacity protein-like surface antigen
MRKAFAGAFLLAGLLIGTTGAGAADVDVDTTYAPEMSGWYLAVSGGLNRIFDLDYEADAGAPFDTDGDIEFNYGWRAGAAVGKYFGDNLRGEIEFAYSNTDADEIDGENVDGSLNIFSVLAKIDFELGEFFGFWHPYLGIGAGAAHVKIDDIGGPAEADGSDTVFAGAIEGGSKFSLTENVDLFTQTQLMFLGDIEGDVPAGSIDIDGPIVLSSSIGLRINF